jgi:hypothetical protein
VVADVFVVETADQERTGLLPLEDPDNDGVPTVMLDVKFIAPKSVIMPPTAVQITWSEVMKPNTVSTWLALFRP